MRLQELRGTYGIKAPAPICADRTRPGARAGADPATCQVVQAPAGGGLAARARLARRRRAAAGRRRRTRKFG